MDLSLVFGDRFRWLFGARFFARERSIAPPRDPNTGAEAAKLQMHS